MRSTPDDSDSFQRGSSIDVGELKTLKAGLLHSDSSGIPAVAKKQSKATSLVRRKTSEEEEDELRYSETNINAHYFQVTRGAALSREEEKAPIQGIINDVNYEVSQLLQNLQEDSPGRRNAKSQSGI